MKFRSCWLIFTLIGLSLTSCSQPKSSQEIAETVKNSIVLISYQNEGGHGTGFIVPGPTGVCTVLTARHVVEGRSLNLQTNDQKLQKIDTIQTSPNLDLAVLTFLSAGKNCPYPNLDLGDSESVKIADQIYISGFPDRAGGGKLVRQFARGYVSGLDVLEQGYGISYEASTFGGMSGGPVLDASGKVVAVHGKTDAQIVADLQSQQASLSPQQQAALQQAAARVAGGGVQINTFRWGIPIKIYLANKSNLVNQPIAAGDSPIKKREASQFPGITSSKKEMVFRQPDDLAAIQLVLIGLCESLLMWWLQRGRMWWALVSVGVGLLGGSLSSDFFWLWFILNGSGCYVLFGVAVVFKVGGVLWRWGRRVLGN